jgi:hypothetical protein
LIVLYFPVIGGVIYLLLKKKVKAVPDSIVLLFVIVTISVASIAWSLLYLDLNAVQLFSNISIVLLNVIFSISLISIYRHEFFAQLTTKIIFFLAMLPVIIQLYRTISWTPQKTAHSAAYLHSISMEVKVNQLRSGVSIKSPDVLQDLFSKYNAVYPLGDYLTLMDDNISIVNIGDFNTPIDSSSALSYKRSLKALESGLFYRQVLNATGGMQPDAETIEARQIAFITENHIEFIVLSANAALPQGLLGKVAKMYTDELTREKFVVLSTNE